MNKEECKQILQKDIFRANLEQGKAYSLIGEKVDTEEVLLEVKEALEREKQERIFCIDVSMQKQDRTDLSRRERYWILWREIMQQCSQCISKEALGSPPSGLVTVSPATLPWSIPAGEVNDPLSKSSALRLTTEPVTSFLVVFP